MIGRWRGRALMLVTGWLALWLGLVLVDYDVRGPILGGVLTAAAMLWWFAQDNAASVEPVDWQGPGTYDATDRPMPSRSRLELRIAVGAEPHLMADEAYRSLRSIVTRRLQARYGVDLVGQPDEARAILGPTVHDYLTGPVDPAGRGYTHRMSAIVDRIEEL